jgi:F420-dependent oxidoreductase-like protein
MREYLSVLMPLVRGEPATFHGEQYTVNGVALDIPGGAPMPVVVAALGPVMLKLAGELADGTNTWMVGPNTMENHIIAKLHKAADDAGRPPPRIVGGFPMALTTNVDAAKEKINEQLVIYGQLPSYRAMLDREGAAGPADIALVGDENALRGQIQRLESIGVTDFNAAIVDVEEGARARTMEFLASLKS